MKSTAVEMASITVEVVVVVMTSPSGTVYMGGQKCPEEMSKSARL